MFSKEQLKGILKFGGLVATLSSFVFLAFALHRQYDKIQEFDWNYIQLLMLLGAVGLTVVFYFVLALSWAIMIQKKGWKGSDLSIALSIYARNSILKYIPGNVFHFIGRNVSGRRLGRGHVRLAGATLFEIVFSIISAVLISALLFLIIDPSIIPASAFVIMGLTILVYFLLMVNPKIVE